MTWKGWCSPKTKQISPHYVAFEMTRKEWGAEQ